MSGSAGDWLDNTYWYVPTDNLPAQLAINTSTPVIATVNDQTVWHFTDYTNGYLDGISATNIGSGWSYTLIVGSVLSDGTVKLSFSPRGAANPRDPTTQTITIGDGTLSGEGSSAAFTMQMSTGTAASSLTHWANMLQVTSSDPAWYSLPGYPATSVPDLTGLQTPIIMPCFAVGTLIATEDGSVAVEDMRAGMQVQTASGALAPVIWCGSRWVDCANHSEPQLVWPVRIAPHAFGPGQPGRALLLSPDHAVYRDGLLIPVKHLINGSTIVQRRVHAVTYYHIELPRHDVVLAEGLPVESYLDTGDRATFVGSGEGRGLQRIPDAAARAWEAYGCAPLVVAGGSVEAIRRQLAKEQRV